MIYDISERLALKIGWTGESAARELKFDISSLTRICPDAKFKLLLRRPGDETSYATATTLDGTTLTWHISASDVEYAGRGTFQVVGIKADDEDVERVVVKSPLQTVGIDQSLEDEIERPGDIWAEEAKQSAEIAEKAAQEAKQSAADAADSARTAQQIEFDLGDMLQKTAQNASAAAASAKAAEASKSEANEAATSAGEQAYFAERSAESAAQNAEKAAESAAAAANNAAATSDSQIHAANSANNAANSASKAADSAEAAKGSADIAAQSAKERCTTKSGTGSSQR